MAGEYVPVYQDPYPDQWANYPATTSPLNADVFQDMAEAIVHIEDFLSSLSDAEEEHF